MGKGEITRYEQFLLFPQCFQKAFFPGASKGVIVWEWVNNRSHKKVGLTHYQTTLRKMAFENSCTRQGENAGNQHYLLPPPPPPPPHTHTHTHTYTIFSIILTTNFSFCHVLLVFSSANAFSLDQSNILSLCKEVKS